MTTPLELVIDTDPGVDDALAILLALAHPAVRLQALTIVHGNVALEQTVSNACRILDAIGGEQLPPVYAGCAAPLARARSAGAPRVHGRDGLGDVAASPSSRPVAREHAASALVRLADEHAGRLVIAAIGPLTNLAVALHLDPHLPAKVRRLIVMGGAVTGQGNVGGGCAEFNVNADPEAAAVVFDRWPSVEVVDWEATLRHGFPGARLDRWLEGGDHRAAFFARISAHFRGRVQRPEEGGRMRAADALALAVAVEPSIVRSRAARWLRVETDGGCRGLTWVDWAGRLGRPPNAVIVEQVAQDRFEGLLRAALGAG